MINEAFRKRNGAGLGSVKLQMACLFVHIWSAESGKHNCYGWHVYLRIGSSARLRRFSTYAAAEKWLSYEVGEIG